MIGFFNRIPIYYRDTLFYIDPLREAIFNHATPLYFVDNNPQHVLAWDSDKDRHYLLTPKPIRRATPMFF